MPSTVKRFSDVHAIQVALFLTVPLTVFSVVCSQALADTREQQVQLETKFVEVNNSQTRDLGTNWGHDNGSFGERGTQDLDIAHARSLDRVGQPGNFGQNQNVFDFNPLNFPGNASAPAPVLTEPKVQTQNNEPAKISTTTQLPATPQSQDSGIKLLVTPQIQNDGKIEMKLQPQADSTKIQVKDGNAVVLGGLNQNNPEKSGEQDPAFGTSFRKSKK